MRVRDKHTTQDRGSGSRTAARLLTVQAIMAKLDQELPDDALRIEVDIEWADGGRVKLEAKA